MERYQKIFLGVLGLFFIALLFDAFKVQLAKDEFKTIISKSSTTNIKDELVKFDNIIKEYRAKNLDENKFNSYLSEYTVSNDQQKIKDKIKYLKMLTNLDNENFFPSKDKRKLKKSFDDYEKQMANIDKDTIQFHNLIKVFNQYKSNNTLGNYVQLQIIVNEYRKKHNIPQKKVIRKVNDKNIKLAYLTFDDGPSPTSEKIVNILNKHNVKGTFFIVGREITKKNNKSHLKYIVDNKNIVGMHGYSHIFKKTAKRSIFKNELDKTKKLIYNNTKYNTSLVRSPYGSFTLGAKDSKYFVSNNYYLWDWNIDTLDWKDKKNYKKVSNRTIKQIKDNKHKKDIVVLYHEYDSTLHSLPKTIEYLKNNNYQIVNMIPTDFYSNYFYETND